MLNYLHYGSAAAVSFARGLNDTPKLAGLLLVTSFFDLPVNIFLLAVAIAVGGWLNARKVAVTMSRKITPLTHGQGFTTNLITSFLVIVASRYGLPVSTTHVSVGSIYGIGMINKTADHRQIASIAAAWVLTMPIAAVTGSLVFTLLKLIA